MITQKKSDSHSNVNNNNNDNILTATATATTTTTTTTTTMQLTYIPVNSMTISNPRMVILIAINNSSYNSSN